MESTIIKLYLYSPARTANFCAHAAGGTKRLWRLAALGALGALICCASTVPRLSLEEMVSRSELIVSGQVTRTWAAWDSRHQFIWTHSEVVVGDVTKGGRMEKVVVSEPGGVVDGVAMRIAGTPTYSPGEQVMLFLERMPNGLLRSAGWGQGKLLVTGQGRLQLTHTGAEIVRLGNANPGTGLESLQGSAATELRKRVTHLVQGVQ